MMDFIDKHPDLTTMRYLMQISHLDGIYGDQQANFTLFAFSDKLLDKYGAAFENMDKHTAYNLIRYSTLNRKMPARLLEDNSGAVFTTKSRDKLLVGLTKEGQILLNGCTRVVTPDLSFTNGIIHIVDDVLTSRREH
jgi:uncharacterized surface protein with fasciclin (FAS1) repeats